MIIMPIIDLLVLPEVTFYFKKDMFPGKVLTSENEGEDLLFLMLKTEKDKSLLESADIYPVGASGVIESIDGEGNVRIRVKERVAISDFENHEGELSATASILPEVADIEAEEEKKLFDKLKKDMMRFAQGFQWGMWARGYILHWKNLNEVGCAVAGYFNMTWEEKYAVMETASRRQRCEMIMAAVYEMMEMHKVGEEAESAQKENYESAYRESALKKQIDFLQKQLDEMHPENISDVRRFEKKLEESGMNEEARKEADKVLNRMKQEGKDGHEYGLLYDYLDFVTSLSWKTEEKEAVDLAEAEAILD